MANIDYADLFYQVRAETPGVPLPLLAAHYVHAVREHLSRSLAWQYSCPSLIDVSAGVDWPTLVSGTDIPLSTYVVQPVRVKWSNGQDIMFKTRDQLDEMYGDWESKTQAIPSFWTITAPGEWRLVPLLEADATESLRLRVALAPSIDMDSASTSIPSYLANEYQGAWANGALSRLLKIPGKDWTNLALAGDYFNLFEDDIRMAKSRAAAEYGRPNRTTVYGGIAMGRAKKTTSGDYGN